MPMWSMAMWAWALEELLRLNQLLLRLPHHPSRCPVLQFNCQEKLYPHSWVAGSP